MGKRLDAIVRNALSGDVATLAVWEKACQFGRSRSRRPAAHEVFGTFESVWGAICSSRLDTASRKKKGQPPITRINRVSVCYVQGHLFGQTLNTADKRLFKHFADPFCSFFQITQNLDGTDELPIPQKAFPFRPMLKAALHCHSPAWLHRPPNAKPCSWGP